jgi:hypothetical protein
MQTKSSWSEHAAGRSWGSSRRSAALAALAAASAALGGLLATPVAGAGRASPASTEANPLAGRCDGHLGGVASVQRSQISMRLGPPQHVLLQAFTYCAGNTWYVAETIGGKVERPYKLPSGPLAPGDGRVLRFVAPTSNSTPDALVSVDLTSTRQFQLFAVVGTAVEPAIFARSKSPAVFYSGSSVSGGTSFTCAVAADSHLVITQYLWRFPAASSARSSKHPMTITLVRYQYTMLSDDEVSDPVVLPQLEASYSTLARISPDTCQRTAPLRGHSGPGRQKSVPI